MGFRKRDVSLGESRVSFLKPNKKELKQLGSKNPRLSDTPHNVKKKKGFGFKDVEAEFKELDRLFVTKKQKDAFDFF